ncbi:hypothetical protein TCAL_05150 [Tigriopus californicus]|uniref:Selenoprotein F/M domain-containing protein n=1 Tax=Tigriopus californicus TaxID=6832 RepID=A0A553NNW2_TIGCA|nr:hypothetical protein TCAL_05150 [Tigriopus californicus]|eukprot:TCALIF_05150-PA protein Name:"Similar to Selm Selenoprotein M (Mus musculus)" AED:0.17 eAED:0.17 QI:0/-1/0/1/-1/1/1/0/112
MNYFSLGFILVYMSLSWTGLACPQKPPTISVARIESCGGCRLQSLPEVRDFLREDFQNLYTHTIWKKMPGKWPELTFRNESQGVVERLDIRQYNRTELNQIMQDRGFQPRTP